MRVVHVIGSLAPAAGGPPAIALRLAAGQLLAGARVRLLTNEHPPETDGILPKRALSPGQELVIDVLPSPIPFGIFRNRTDGVRLRDLVAGADVIHLHGIWEPLLLAAARAARCLSVPYVVMPHGMLDPWSLAQKRWKKRAALALGYRRMLNAAAALHLGNADEAMLIAPLGLTSPQRIIPNGVFLEEIEPLPLPGEFRSRHRELSDRPFVLFLSRLHYKKGLDHLAEAFRLIAADMPSVQLVVAGPDDGARADFETRMATCGLTARVHIVGPLYGREKLAAFVDADCFCLPSRQEGFSIAILEALACGTPVVISENCHFPEVGAAGAGRVVPLDPPAIAVAIREVLNDEPLRKQMAASGRALIERRYTWQRVAAMCIDLYAAVSRKRLAAAGGKGVS